MGRAALHVSGAYLGRRPRMCGRRDARDALWLVLTTAPKERVFVVRRHTRYAVRSRQTPSFSSHLLVRAHPFQNTELCSKNKGSATCARRHLPPCGPVGPRPGRAQSVPPAAEGLH